MNGSWPRAERLAGITATVLALAACQPSAPEPPPVPDPEAAIRAALAATPDPDNGRIVFRAWCIFCHGDQIAGEPPTDFDLGEENPRKFKGYELNHEEHVRVIVTGYVSKERGVRNMPAFALRITAQEVADVAAYEQRIMARRDGYRDHSDFSWQKKAEALP